MIRQIVSGYLGILRALLSVAVMLALCVGAGALIAWPLWKLATSDPAIYTVIFCVLAAGIVALIAASRIRAAYRRHPRSFLVRTVSVLVLVLGFAGAVLLVLAWQRLFAAAVIVMTLALYGFLAFGIAPGNRKSGE
jgi:uncharacterized membrane protein